jgi:hypothetical protein
MGAQADWLGACLSLSRMSVPLLTSGAVMLVALTAVPAFAESNDRTEVALSTEGTPLKPVKGSLPKSEPAPEFAPIALIARPDPGQEVDRGPKEPSYRDLLGQLVVTRDLGIPGIEGIALRLIPTRAALAGSPAPVVFIPRILGTEWYGAEIVARF